MVKDAHMTVRPARKCRFYAPQREEFDLLIFSENINLCGVNLSDRSIQ